MATARSTSTRPAVLEDEEVAEAPAEERRTKRGNKSQPETEAQAKGRLRNAAERFVLNNHRDEYYAKLEQLHAAEGREYKRVLSAEEKDEKALEELLARRPDLRAKVIQDAAPEAVPADFETQRSEA